MKIITHTIIAISFLLSCNTSPFVNAKTSEIGTLNTICLKKDAWDSLKVKYSINKIKDSIFFKSAEGVKNHFIKPTYILFFEEGPKEIIGCRWNDVRVVFNPLISSEVLDGLSPTLTEYEKKRIKNRVQNALMNYECEKGKNESKKLISD